MKNKLIILMYHSIGKQDNAEIGEPGLYSISKNIFKEQMEYLSNNGNSNFILTFDDGDITHHKYAYPIIRNLGLRAYFFIIVSKIGNRGYMNWEQIKELRDNKMLIGSHGMTHRILTELKDQDLDYELRASKKFLEDNLGHRVDYFSIPRGFYNKKVIDKAKEVGYKGIFTSNVKDKDGFRFGRIPVRGNWSLEYFIRVFNNGLSLKDRTQEWFKNSSKIILGVRNYDRLRMRILKK